MSEFQHEEDGRACEWRKGEERMEKGRGGLNCCITIGVYHHHHYSMGSVAKDERKSSLIEEEQRFGREM